MNSTTGGNGMVSTVGVVKLPLASPWDPEQPVTTGTVRGRGYFRASQAAAAMVSWLAALAHHLGSWLGRGGA
jgi:hypothetical protein